MDDIFLENVVAKILQVAQRIPNDESVALDEYPERVDEHGRYPGRYIYRDASYWTCGFFPGSIYTLLERLDKFPDSLQNFPGDKLPSIRKTLSSLGTQWILTLRQMSSRTDTHDLGFMMMPALKLDWELNRDRSSFNMLSKAAHSLASRFDARVKALRCWNSAQNRRLSIPDTDENFLTIIDSMCNLDLLYYIGFHECNPGLLEVATTHAHTVLNSHLRPDSSTFHLVNFSPQSGQEKQHLTFQGYKDWSTWSRGQAWAILGFAQAYQWSKDRTFLETSIACADYFLHRLHTCQQDHTHSHPYVPLWDFDAPPTSPIPQPRDSSAGVIAANGLLLIYESLNPFKHQSDNAAPNKLLETEPDTYLTAAQRIIRETVDMCADRDFARIDLESLVESTTPTRSQPQKRRIDIPIHASSFDAILKHATSNNNEDAFDRLADHGLVYADYYFLEYGNKLLRMGLASTSIPHL